MKELTQRQAEILAYICDTIGSSGIPPTIAEITAAMGLKSPHGTRGHLQALERKGAIELIPGASRGIRLLQADRKVLGLPIVGRVAAGSPILAEEHIEGHFKIDPRKFTPRPHYLLQVQGMSMRDAGILDGDLLAVHRTVEAHNGQIVVARLENEVTVKRWKRKGHKVWLSPENPQYKTIEVDLRKTELVLEGLGVGIVRNKGLV
ncbi:MAG: transcriptional repressor LexA [Gammaproteobacteria bacterium]|nr:transcriptional repressor LexA [Gammaproteobacteria bacterium]